MQIPSEFNLDFNVQNSIVLLGFAGSHSYGTNREGSDIDYKGIFVPPNVYNTSPFKTIEQLGWKLKDGKYVCGAHLSNIANAEEEATIFAIKKFFCLAADCNPNIIELLYIRSEDVILSTPVGDLLRAERSKFLSQKAAKTFVGYSTAQLHRIVQHKQYLMHPPDHKPTRAEWGLSELTRVNPDQLNACRAFIRRNMITMAPWLLEADNQHREAFWEGVVNLLAIRDGTPEFNNNLDNWHEIEEGFAEDIAAKMSFDTDFMEHLRKEKKFSQARSEYEKYLEWQKNRNVERAKTEVEWGYDVKHGMHLIRLLRMGHQVLTTGTMDVYRPDRQELLDIRHGKWPYEKLVEESTRMTDEIYSLIRENKTCLPKLPDQKYLEDLNTHCLELHYANN